MPNKHHWTSEADFGFAPCLLILTRRLIYLHEKANSCLLESRLLLDGAVTNQCGVQDPTLPRIKKNRVILEYFRRVHSRQNFSKINLLGRSSARSKDWKALLQNGGKVWFCAELALSFPSKLKLQYRQPSNVVNTQTQQAHKCLVGLQDSRHCVALK